MAEVRTLNTTSRLTILTLLSVELELINQTNNALIQNKKDFRVQITLTKIFNIFYLPNFAPTYMKTNQLVNTYISRLTL